MIFKQTILSFLFLLITISFVSAQLISIDGTIKDLKGKPIPSASVRINKSNTGTSANSLGSFQILAKANDDLIFSAIGFADTTLSLNGRTHLEIVLRSASQKLKEVVVSGNNENSRQSSLEEVEKEQIIGSTIQNYLRQSEFSNGVLVVNQFIQQPKGYTATNTIINGFGPLNTLTSGTMLPVIEHKEDTRGSRYLFPHYVNGLTIDTGLHATNYTTNMLNFDKIDGQLMVQQDPKNFLEVDKNIVDAFALKTDDTALIFLKVPILSKINYFILIANGPKYSAYKSVRTKFIKSNYISNGLTESGNNYDEYVDNQTYYWVDQTEGKAGLFELKKKSIKEIFPSQKARIDTFWSSHKSEDIDENFVRNLIHYLNQ